MAEAKDDADEIGNLLQKRQVLTLRVENARLRLELAGLNAPLPTPLPWWRDGSTIKTLGALVAVVIPITTFAQGWVQKSRELDLQTTVSGMITSSAPHTLRECRRQVNTFGPSDS